MRWRKTSNLGYKYTHPAAELSFYIVHNSGIPKKRRYAGGTGLYLVENVIALGGLALYNESIMTISYAHMLSKTNMALGAVAAGILIAVTQFFDLAGELNYVWAFLVLVWGFLIWKQK